MGQVAASLEEGNPLDRSICSLLILLAIGILLSRSFKWGDLLTRNVSLSIMLVFALLSVFWSDYSFVAAKRWFRDLGNYLIVLVIVSDPRPVEAVRTVLRRLSYLLLPLSIVFVKYYPALGKQYDPWSGGVTYTGVTTSKNTLGVVCLLGGLFFFWELATRWARKSIGQSRRVFVTDIAFIAMAFWLLILSNSATSRICLILGCLVIAVAHKKPVNRHLKLLKVLIPVSFCLYLVLAFGFNINANLAGAVGRDPTLTDRTKIWAALLGMHTDPLVGTGYESFWLGPRLQFVWNSFGPINEAHNGYLEVYLNLGLIGLFFLGIFLIASYRTICKNLIPHADVALLAFVLWTVLLFHSVTEADFRGGLLWLTFVLGTLVVDMQRQKRVTRHASANMLHEEIPTPSLALTGDRTS